MPEQDIYKLVEQINKNKKISDESKITDFYNLLEEINNQSESPKTILTFGDEGLEKRIEEARMATTVEPRTSTLSDLKDKAKPIIKPAFPTMILPYDTRSECFLNIIKAVEYGDNNSDYKKGHEDALARYYVIANNNRKDLYVVEGQVKDELNKNKSKIGSSNYYKGYHDGLEYVQEAIIRSKNLLAKKIFEDLEKELG